MVPSHVACVCVAWHYIITVAVDILVDFIKGVKRVCVCPGVLGSQERECERASLCACMHVRPGSGRVTVLGFRRSRRRKDWNDEGDHKSEVIGISDTK